MRVSAALFGTVGVAAAIGLFGVSVSGAQPRADTPSACTSLDACRHASARGQYDLAVAGLTRLRRGRTRVDATLEIARIRLAQGRYADAAALVRPLCRRGRPIDRGRAATTLGEAELSRGQLDGAERALTSAAARPEAHRARVLLGRLLIRRGRDSDARSHLMALVQAYNDETIARGDAEGLTYVAMAAAMLDSPHDATDAFLEALRINPCRVETLLEFAELYLSHNDLGTAEERIRAALSVNPNSARAHALMARVRLAQSLDFVGAAEELEHSLQTNPSLVIAHVTRAGIAIRDMELDRATRHLDAALAVDGTDLEALSVRAAIHFLRDDRAAYDQSIRAVLALNPRFSRVYSIIAEYADWEHRYPAIVDMARRALRIDPDDAEAHATLGLNLLRLGRESEGLGALRQAWRRDRFNVRVFNTLEFYDDVIARQYEEVQARPFVFRFHREERAILERYAVPLLRLAWNDMRGRYRFTPRTPVRIEMFASNEHFSVRTSGLPNIGVQGVCFGSVVTALSPRGGPFNWGQITWHELSHVFHLQLSRNRVPRWFTEGLAEYETTIARPEWAREEDHRLHLAFAAGRVPPLSRLNHAFTHARSADAMSTAYYVSSMLVRYIVDRFGFARIPRMLREWGQGRTTQEVIRRVLGVSVADLDRDFRASEGARLAPRGREFFVDYARYDDVEGARRRAQVAPTDAQAQAELAATLMSEDRSAARAAAQRALELDGAQPIALFVLADLALASRDAAEAEQFLRHLIASGHDGYEIRLRIARTGFMRRRPRAVRSALEAAVRIDAGRPEAWQGLVTVAPRLRDEALQVRALTRLAEVDQHDRQTLARLLTLLARANRWDDVRRFAERSIYVDPHRGESHRLLAEALLRGGRAVDALPETEAALATSMENEGSVHLLRARILYILRRDRQAREALRRAVAADAALTDQAAALRARPPRRPHSR